MVRRWSYLNEINKDFRRFNVFEKRHKISNFKVSVNFKRFTFKITKFKRKALVRLKHRSTFLLYTNIVKLWSKDYLFNKHLARFQCYNKVTYSNFFFYNFNFTRNRSESLRHNFNFFFSVLSKKVFKYYHPASFSYFKYSPIVFAWSYKTPSLNNTTVPTCSEWDDCFYPFYPEKKSQFNFSEIFNLFPDLILKKTIEIKKILLLLFYFKTLELKKF